LTEKLLPKLSKSKGGGRIVQISSAYHWTVDGSDLAVPVLTVERGKDTTGMDIDMAPVASLPGGSHGYELWRTTRQYANSKLAQILHMRALQRRTTTTNGNGNNVKVVSVCPSWVATNIAAANGTLVHDLSQYWMFPADGFGLSSILRAVLNADDDPEGDFYINNAIVMWFAPGMDRIPSWLSKYTPFLDLMGSLFAMGPLFHFQKLFPVATVTPSSKASYNEELQEQLYQWSYQQVSKWL
jgi:NAD(P)-dependent dehydrogenase (short-subunit alcohol dehydrogenase family)